MNTITIIGTNPPCPRCGLLTAVITELVAEQQIDAKIIHLAYHDKEAVAIAGSFGMVPGTAKDVGKALGNPVDQKELAKALKSADRTEKNEYSPYNSHNWRPELDEFLRPWEEAAPEAGIMMTPVLLINGEIKHQGSIPSLSALKDWLDRLKEPSHKTGKPW